MIVTKKMISQLAKRFPVFVADRWEPHQPLVRGIHRTIYEQWPEVDKKALSVALRAYVGRRQYLNACAADGAMRIDLAGTPVEPVSEGDRKGAQARLAKLNAKVEADIDGFKKRRQERRDARQEQTAQREQAFADGIKAFHERVEKARALHKARAEAAIPTPAPLKPPAKPPVVVVVKKQIRQMSRAELAERARARRAAGANV